MCLFVRSSHPVVFWIKDALKIFAKFMGKHLCWSLFFNEVASLRNATLLKKRIQNRYFPVNFTKFWRTPFSKEHLRWLLTAWKVSKFGVFSGPYFPVFGLNAEIYFVNLRIQSKYGKIRTRKNSVFEHVSRSDFLYVVFEDYKACVSRKQGCKRRPLNPEKI